MSNQKLDQKLFLSREQLLEFKTITYLLSNLNDFNHSNVTRAVVDVAKSSGNRAKDVKLWEYLSHLANILVRGDEVLAITPSSLDLHLHITQSIHSLGEKDAAMDQQKSLPRLSITLESKPEDLPNTNTQELLAKQMYDRYNVDGVVPLEKHAQMIVKLLQAWHQSSPSDRDRCRVRLEFYIFSVSAKKMKNRYRHGMPGRFNFEDIINRSMDYEDTEKVLPGTLSDSRKPDEDQQDFINYCINGEAGDEARAVFKPEDLENPIFDAKGRHKLLQIFKIILASVKQSLEDADSAQALEAPDRWAGIENTTLTAMDAMLQFGLFMYAFREEVRDILRWLMAYFNVSRKREDIPRQTPGFETAVQLRGGASPSGADMLDSKGQEANEQNADKDTEEADESDDESDKLFDLEFKKGEGSWDAAVSFWLSLIQLHSRSLLFLSPNEGKKPSTFGTILTKLDLDSVIIKSDKKDNDMADIRFVIAKYMANPDNLDEEGRQIRVDEICQALTQYTKLDLKGRGQDPMTCNAVLHCETIIMGLNLLAEKNVSIDPDHPMFSLPSEVLAQFRSNRLLGNAIGLSKRCCPACQSLMEYVRKHQFGEKKLVYGGWHCQWSAVALPPFIPASAGQHVIEHASAELVTRLEACLQRAQRAGSPKRDRSFSFNTDSEEKSPPKKPKYTKAGNLKFGLPHKSSSEPQHEPSLSDDEDDPHKNLVDRRRRRKEGRSSEDQPGVVKESIE